MAEKQWNIEKLTQFVCDKLGDYSHKNRIAAAIEEYFEQWFFTMWHWDDIKQQAHSTFDREPEEGQEFDDDILTDEQCQEIEDFILRQHDATIGINWDVIECAIQEVVK